MIDEVLLSPKVNELVDDAMAQHLAAQAPAVMARPAETVVLRRGPIQAWGVELTSEDGQRAYRVAFVVEDDDSGRPILSICALEEKSQLEAPLARRRKLKGWRSVQIRDSMESE